MRGLLVALTVLAGTYSTSQGTQTTPSGSGVIGGRLTSAEAGRPVRTAAIAPSSAARVRVGVGEQLSGIDIQLRVLKTGLVTGRVTSAQGEPVAARLQLIDPSMPVANLTVWFRNAAADGRFAFRGIPPGIYVERAQASAGAGAGERTAAADVQVDEAGTHDVALTLRAGVSASGALDLASLPGIDIRKLQVDLMVISGPSDWELPLGTAVPDAEGGFVIRGLAPGRYRVGVRGLPEGWTLASATFDDRDAADYHLTVERSNIRGGLLKFTSRTAQISGTVTNPSGDAVTDRVVLVFPEANHLWVSAQRIDRGSASASYECTE